MRQKIFDITPPKTPATFQEEEVAPPQFEKKKQGEIKRKAVVGKKGIIFSLAFLVVIFIILYVFIEPKAEIEVWPESRTSDFRTQTALLSVIEEINFSEGFIPSEVFEVESSISQEFPSSGTAIKNEKAGGTIQVYNAYSTYSQPLIATTRFVSDEGKLFRTPKRVVIPGAHYEKGKLVPGTIDIKVVADQPGQEYNIGPSAFSIPGFAGTAKYTAFYGKSFESMTGGLITEVPQVTQGDLDKAEEILTEKALRESKISLDDKIPPDFIAIEETRTEGVIDISSLAEADQEIEKFFMQVKTRTSILGFKKSDIEDFTKTYIRSIISQQQELQEDSLNAKYSLKTFELEQDKVVLDIEASAKIYSAIDKDSLKEIVKGKNPSEIKEIFRNYPEITRTQVKLWPFWARKAPFDLERIEIKLNLD